jgi:hypothetical protein
VIAVAVSPSASRPASSRSAAPTASACRRARSWASHSSKAGSRARQPFEGQHVDGDRARLQGDRFAVGLDRRRAVLRQAVAQGRQGLAQGALGLGVAPVAPQQPGKLVARARLALGERQVGEQGLGLAGRQGDLLAAVEPGLEAAEQFQIELGHGSSPLASLGGRGTWAPRGAWRSSRSCSLAREPPPA